MRPATLILTTLVLALLNVAAVRAILPQATHFQSSSDDQLTSAFLVETFSSENCVVPSIELSELEWLAALCSSVTVSFNEVTKHSKGAKGFVPAIAPLPYHFFSRPPPQV